MKLIDILVRELPKVGGWPEGAVECQRFVDEATIDFYDKYGNWPDDCALAYGSIALELVRKQNEPCEHEKVSFAEYEAALDQRKLVESWSGEGLPPVDVDVEYRHKGADNWSYTGWLTGRVVWFGNAEFCVVNCRGKAKVANIGEWDFRPLRTEADKRRDAAIDCIANLIHRSDPGDDAASVYDSIAEGKIPGVKLED